MGKKTKPLDKARKTKKISNEDIEKLEQLSERHAAALKTALHLKKRMDEQLEQLSQRHEASINKISDLTKRVDEQLEQLSERHAAVVHKINAIEKILEKLIAEKGTTLP